MGLSQISSLSLGIEFKESGHLHSEKSVLHSFILANAQSGRCGMHYFLRCFWNNILALKDVKYVTIVSCVIYARGKKTFSHTARFSVSFRPINCQSGKQLVPT